MEIESQEPRLRIVSWNMCQMSEGWKNLVSIPYLDVALVQEAIKPQEELAWSVPSKEEFWGMLGYQKKFCAAVVGLSKRATDFPFEMRRLGDIGKGLEVSRPGSLAAAEVTLADREKIILVSVYSVWENQLKGRGIYADASAHRLISDISSLVANENSCRVIVAGDLNILYGYGEKGSPYWKTRYDTVFARMKALGMPFVGPQYPHGIQADPWPDELPKDNKNVPTFRTHKKNPSSATRQLDFVFASTALHDRMRVKALNAQEEWGPSDHCRISIDLW